jgi:hypothetical protein
MPITTVYDKSATLAGTDDGGSTNLNARVYFPASLLSAASGNQIRITALFGSGQAASVAQITSMWVGQRIGGNNYDFTGDQVQMLFGGVGTIDDTTGGGQVVVSDFVNLAQNWDNTKDYVIAFHGNSNHQFNACQATVTGNIQYFQVGADSSSANTFSPLGNNANTAFFIEKIEIQGAAASPGAPGILGLASSEW